MKLFIKTLRARRQRPGASRVRWQRWIMGARGCQTRRGLPWPRKKERRGQAAKLPQRAVMTVTDGNPASVTPPRAAAR